MSLADIKRAKLRERHLAYVLCSEVYLEAGLFRNGTGRVMRVLFPDDPDRYHVVDVSEGGYRHGWLIFTSRHLLALLDKHDPKRRRRSQTANFPVPVLFEGSPPTSYPDPPIGKLMPPSRHEGKRDERADFEVRRKGTSARADMATYEAGEHSAGGLILDRGAHGSAYTVELKSEVYSMSYGRGGVKGVVIVEHECRGGPSSIAVSEADYWAFEWLPSQWLIISRTLLKQHWEHFRLFPARVAPCGDKDEHGEKVGVGVKIALAELLEKVTKGN